jgi:signal transduction histidine kinase
LFGVLPMRDLTASRQAARDRLAAFGIAVRDLERPVVQLSGGERQLLTIMRVVRPEARLVVLDEPTASLGVHQGSQVLELVRRIAKTGRSVIYVTHDVEEVFEIADRVVVLQRGEVIFDGPLVSLSRLELLGLMSGRNRKEAKRTLEAVAEERVRIERDLHDGAQGELLHAALMVGLAVDSLGRRADPRLAELLETSRDTIQQALATLRNLSHGIYPLALSEGGLEEAVSGLAKRSILPIDLRIEVPRLPENVERTAYFVIAEALSNAQKHADCAQVTVSATHTGHSLQVVVSDDGRGGATEGGGSGLRGVRARLAALDGRMSLVSTVGAGTRLEVSLPAMPVG